MDATRWAAVIPGVSALAALLTAAFAIVTIRQAAQDSRDRTRPVVIVRLTPGPKLSHGYLYLIMQNMGDSVARDLAVTFDPEMTSRETDAGQRLIAGPFIRRRYSRKMPLLAPKERLSNTYYAFEHALQSGVPKTCRVSVEYRDDRDKTYRDSVLLDVDAHGEATSANPGGKDYDKRQTQGIEAAVWELWGR